MNIIKIGNFITGIFINWDDAQNYLRLKPESIKGYVHLNNSNQYPFYILELPRGTFEIFQTRSEVPIRNGGVLYIINQDYAPPTPWTDHMGSLDHIHLEELDQDIDNCL